MSNYITEMKGLLSDGLCKVTDGVMEIPADSLEPTKKGYDAFNDNCSQGIVVKEMTATNVSEVVDEIVFASKGWDMETKASEEAKMSAHIARSMPEVEREKILFRQFGDPPASTGPRSGAWDNQRGRATQEANRQASFSSADRINAERIKASEQAGKTRSAMRNANAAIRRGKGQLASEVASHGATREALEQSKKAGMQTLGELGAAKNSLGKWKKGAIGAAVAAPVLGAAGYALGRRNTEQKGYENFWDEESE
jgi:hypothetical protein